MPDIRKFLSLFPRSAEFVKSISFLKLHSVDLSKFLTNHLAMTLSKIFVAIAAALQISFMILEIFFWTKTIGRKAFNLTNEFAEQSKVLAMNQGLYNGFIAAGFIWALLHSDPIAYYQLSIFFSSCMLIAGVFGAVTAGWKIILVQGLPAALVLASIIFYW